MPDTRRDSEQQRMEWVRVAPWTADLLWLLGVSLPVPVLFAVGTHMALASVCVTLTQLAALVWAVRDRQAVADADG